MYLFERVIFYLQTGAKMETNPIDKASIEGKKIIWIMGKLKLK